MKKKKTFWTFTVLLLMQLYGKNETVKRNWFTIADFLNKNKNS